jgi:hypothetical protein
MKIKRSVTKTYALKQLEEIGIYSAGDACLQNLHKRDIVD